MLDLNLTQKVNPTSLILTDEIFLKSISVSSRIFKLDSSLGNRERQMLDQVIVVVAQLWAAMRNGGRNDFQVFTFDGSKIDRIVSRYYCMHTCRPLSRVLFATLSFTDSNVEAKRIILIENSLWPQVKSSPTKIMICPASQLFVISRKQSRQLP